MSFFNKKNMTAGTSMVELLVVMSLVGIVMPVAFTAYHNQSRVIESQNQFSEMEQNVRGALDVMVQDIRQAGIDPTGSNFSAVPYNADSLELYADLNGDGDVTDQSEYVSYRCDAVNNTIIKTINGEDQIIAEYISSMSIAYLDSDNQAVVDAVHASNIRSITITVVGRTVTADPQYHNNNGFRTSMVSSTITPYNLSL